MLGDFILIKNIIPKEAADLANSIDCKIVVPTHYAELVGRKEDLEEFIKITNKEAKVFICK